MDDAAWEPNPPEFHRIENGGPVSSRVLFSLRSCVTRSGRNHDNWPWLADRTPTGAKGQDATCSFLELLRALDHVAPLRIDRLCCGPNGSWKLFLELEHQFALGCG